MKHETYDIVLRNGRVLDPESGLDATEDVGIRGNIAAVSRESLRGNIELDVSGLVVAPGFIDLHSHGQDTENYRFKAMDGVTTALELEVGVSPLAEWYAAREGKSLINFGASSGHIPARIRVMKDSGKFLPQDAAMNRRATPDEQSAIAIAVRRGLETGGLGVGFGLEYTPPAGAEEILELFRLAAEFKRPVYVHVRFAGYSTPGIFEALQEVIADAAASGASLHVVHLNSMAGAKAPQALRMIEGARARGLDITTEAYPYTAASTRLESALFDPGWQERRGMSYSDVMWLETGERLTAESFEHHRKRGGWVIMFMNTEELVRDVLAHPLAIIASDGVLENGIGHPRSAGTFARILGKYVHEEKVLSLMEAIRKCSLAPAQRLEAVAPQMRRKGRLQAGADADIAVFDPERVIDKATFEKPAQYSEGFRHVLVNGTFVVRDGELQHAQAPGKAISAP